MNPSLRKKLIVALVVVTALLVAGTLSIFIGYRFVADTPNRVLKAITEQTSMTINQLRQTATRNGIKEWVLDAASASLAKGGKEALLEDLTVTFFTSDQKKIHLRATSGTLFIDTNDFELTGDININNDRYHLQTEKLQYHHKDRIITVSVPVAIQGGGMHFTGDSMTFDLNTNRTLLEGNVEGSIAFTP